MSAAPKSPSPSEPTPSTINPDIDEQLQGLWTKYGQTLVTALTMVAVFWLGREGWNYYQQQKEASLGKEFAALTTPVQWKKFAEDHPNDRLSGLADLQVADDAYTSGQVASAAQSYQAAANLLKGDPLQTRARIGAAVCLIQSGQNTEGEMTLRAILGDPNQLPVMRVQAGYEVASAVADEGKADELAALVAQINSIDKNPRDPWVYKANRLRVVHK
ncbi:MAG TPA: tetratricopeptide repeat protein [Opitutaceae bacterium]|jgi:hypothetical protein